MFDLAGKRAVVTGGASGIGEAIARRFKAAGARVLVADIADAGATVEGWGGAYRRTDVTCAQDVAALLEQAVEQFGGIDILVNNAGIARTGDIEHVGGADADRMYAVNTAAMLWGMREGAKRMRSGAAPLGEAARSRSCAMLIGCGLAAGALLSMKNQ